MLTPHNSSNPYLADTLPRGSACLRCKANKRKCDASRPVCSTCRRTGHASKCRYQRSALLQKHAFQRLSDRMNYSARILRTNPIPPEIVLLNHSADWWRKDEIPPTLHDFLINIFLNHAPQVHFDELTANILTRLSRYPSNHISYPYPSLLNAIYLISSFFLSSPSHPARIERRVNWNPSEIEQSFLRKARMAIFRSVPLPEHLFDIFLSMRLLVMYFYSIQNRVEGYRLASDAMRTAIICNLHIVSTSQVDSFPISVIPQPKNQFEIRDWVNAWWSLYIMDRARSIYSGQQATIADEDITTIFSPDVQSAPPDQSSSSTVSSLCLVNSRAAETGHDTQHIMKAKAMALLGKVAKLAVRAAQEGTKELKHTSTDFQKDFYLTETAIVRMMTSFPTTTTSSGSNLATVAALQAMACSGLIRLHGPFSLHDEDSRAKVFGMAQRVVASARELESGNEIYWHLPLSVGWLNACEVFQQEIGQILSTPLSALSDSNLDEKKKFVLRMRSDMMCLEGMMKRWVKVYRFHQNTLSLIQQMLAKDTLAIAQFTGVEL